MKKGEKTIMRKIGTLIALKDGIDVKEKMRELKNYGFECCQLVCWKPGYYTESHAEEIKAAVSETGIEVTTLWAGWSGPAEWNFHCGPATLGLVPPAYRMKRAEELVAAGEFAVKANIPQVATHVGFLPENMSDPEYWGMIAILRQIMTRFQKWGLNFLFETGQETPVTLLRVIEELGMNHVGINMDTANLILYGKANSADAISVFGKYVLDTHIKDGLYPTDGKNLGKEVKVGEGMANIPEVIRRLEQVGYTGNYIIEREISGEQQIKDILETKIYLESILKGRQ